MLCAGFTTLSAEESSQKSPPPSKNILESAVASDQLPPPQLPIVGIDNVPTPPVVVASVPDSADSTSNGKDKSMLPGPPKNVPKGAFNNNGVNGKAVAAAAKAENAAKSNAGKALGHTKKGGPKK